MKKDNPKSTLSDTPQIFFSMDPAGTIMVDIKNSEFAVGYKEITAPTTEQIFSVLAPADRSKIHRDHQKLLKGQVILNSEYRFIKQDGSFGYVVVNAFPIIENGKLKLIKGVASDVSDKFVKAEHLVMAQHALESSINGIVFNNKDRKIVYVNQAFLAMFGYDRKEEVLGKDIREVTDPGNNRRAMTVNFEKNRNWEGEVIGIKKDGSKCDIKLSASFIKDESGRVLCVMGSMIDITESKRLELEIQEQNVLLNEKNIALKELMQQVHREKESLEKQMQANINRIVMPMLTHLRKRNPAAAKNFIDMLEESLRSITSRFGQSITSHLHKLSRREVELCGMLRHGMSSKEIAAALNINERTVCVHRNRIRKKLGIINQKVNLTTYLSSL
jgi:PAS domain S-box-containing protein